MQNSEGERREQERWEKAGEERKAGGPGFQPLQALGPLLTEPLPHTTAKSVTAPRIQFIGNYFPGQLGCTLLVDHITVL